MKILVQSIKNAIQGTSKNYLDIRYDVEKRQNDKKKTKKDKIKKQKDKKSTKKQNKKTTQIWKFKNFSLN